MRTVFVIVVALVSSTALADRISGAPPADCPAGSYPHVDHGGPHCAFVRCTSDTECTHWDPELRCGPVASICVVTDEFNTYTRRPNQRERAAAACVDGACSEGTCETQRFCVRQAVPPDQDPTQDQAQDQNQQQQQQQQPDMSASASASASESESGCSAGGTGAGAWLLLLFLLPRRKLDDHRRELR